jgi:predicted ester cyclase
MGGDALRTMLRGVLAQFPDCRFEVESSGATSDTTAAAQWTMLATQASDGRTITLRGADFFTLDEATDRIATVVGYFDQVALRRQLS